MEVCIGEGYGWTGPKARRNKGLQDIGVMWCSWGLETLHGSLFVQGEEGLGICCLCLICAAFHLGCFQAGRDANGLS